MLYDIGLILIHIGGWMFVVGTFVLLPIVWIITVPYYDKVLGFKKIYNPLIEAYGALKGVFKAAYYGTLVVVHKGMKKSMERIIYGDFDFNHQARLIDKIICYPFFIFFCGGLFMVLVSALFFGLAKLAS